MISKIAHAFNRLSGSMKFLLVVVLAYLLVWLARPGVVIDAFQSSAGMLWDMVPVLVFAFFILFLNFMFVGPEMIRKHLGADSGMKGWLYALFGSLVLSGPPYVLLPILGELQKAGARYALIAAFLNVRSVNAAFLPVMAYYFGFVFTVVFFVFVVLVSFVTARIVGARMSA